MEPTHIQNKIQETTIHHAVEQIFEHDEPLEQSINANVDCLQEELKWITDLVRFRVSGMKSVLDGKGEIWLSAPQLISAPVLPEGAYREFVLKHELNYAERLLLIMCFSAAYDTDVLGHFCGIDPDEKKQYQCLGGRIDQDSYVFYPTLQTLLFLLAGKDRRTSAKYLYHLRKRSKLFVEQIVYFVKKEEDTGYWPNREVRLDSTYYDYFLFSERPRLDAGDHFPARLLQTDKTFDDLILPENTIAHLKPAMDYLRNQKKVFEKEGASGKIKGGHVMMLYGPPGTGKTLTASIIGRHLGVDVYAIELSQIVSKYIGETEKNIDKVFERLQDKNCIIFFDEADALFGKRTEVKDAKDKYANQETSHLLQKVEQCNALIILASNFKQNLDDAFTRRILTYVHIPPPEEEERFKMWRKGIPQAYEYEPVDLPEKLAKNYQLTGANITNIIKLSCFDAEDTGTHKLTKERLEHFIRKELLKENRKQPSFNGRQEAQQVSQDSKQAKRNRPVPTSINPNPAPQQTAPTSSEAAESTVPIALPEGFTPQPDPNPVYRRSTEEDDGFREGVRVQAMSEAEARRKGLISDSPKSKRRGRGKR